VPTLAKKLRECLTCCINA
jgi:hypothetical protein